MNVADQYAGQSGPCSRCGKPITIPGTPAAPGTPFYPPPKPASKAPILIIVLAVAVPMVFVCGGILLALLLPAVQAAREAARRVTCQNNLKQIGSALLNYEAVNRCYPPAVFTDGLGKPMKSWRVAILPYMDQQPLYQQYDSKQPWDSPQNRALGNTPLPIFRCPSDPGETASGTETDYVRIVGKNTVGGMPNEAVKLNDITNGASNTIMVAEVFGLNIPWEEPRDVTADEFVDMVAKSAAQGRRSPHTGGFHVLMADGSVQFIDRNVDPNKLRAMLLRQPFTNNVEQTFQSAAQAAANIAAMNRPWQVTPPATKRVIKPPESPQDFAALVSDLDSGDFSRRIRATGRLLRAKPKEPNAAVAKALERVLLEEGNVPIRVNAAAALVNWGTAESIPALQEAAQKDSNPLVRSRATKAIEAIKLRQ
jgi:prepilin-type processing-associated H-X9-DG protein